MDSGNLESLLALNGVGEHSIGLGVGVSLDQASDSLSKKLDVIKRVVSLDSLVQVRVEGHLLDVLGVAKFNKGFAGTVVAVEDLLQNVQYSVSGSVGLVVLLDVGLFDFGLSGKSLSSVHKSDNFFGGHASRLGGEVDTFTGALGNVSSSISDKGHASLDTSRAVVFRDGVSLNLDDLSSGNLVTGTVTDGLLVLLDGGAVDNGTSSNSDVVVLGEDPSVEIGGNIISDVHLGHFFVELHLVIRDLNSLLEGNGKVVKTGIHGLGDTRVGTVGSDNKIDFHGFGNTGTGSLLELLVVDGVGGFRNLVVRWDINGGHKSVDTLGTVFDGTVSKELVHNFTSAHTDVFVGLQGVTDIDLNASGGDEVHLADL